MSGSLQVRECTEEVRTPRRGPIATTDLREFQSGLLLKPKAREVYESKDYPADTEGVYGWGDKHVGNESM